MANTPAQVALDEKGLEAAARIIRPDIWEREPNPATERYCASLRQEATDQAETVLRAYLSSLSGHDGQGALVERGGYRFRWHENSPWTVSDTFQDEAYVCEPLYADAGSALTRENAALRADKERLERERSKFIREAGKHFAKSCELAARAEAAEASVKELERDLSFADQQAEKVEALLEPHVSWEGEEPDAETQMAYDAADRLITRADLAEQGQVTVDCDRCAGNGEIVTDWDRYRHPHDGDVGDEAVAACPDCFGVGTVAASPISQEPVAWGYVIDGKLFALSPNESVQCPHPLYATPQPLTEGEPSEAEVERIAKHITEWLGHSWEWLGDGSVVAKGSPVFTHGQFGWGFQGRKDDMRDLARVLLAAKSKGGRTDG